MKLQPLLLKDRFRLLIVGGGAGGCAVAARFARVLPHNSNQVAVVEPNSKHYYQPGFTLAASGLMSFNQLVKEEKSVLPNSKSMEWIQDSVTAFHPEQNHVILSDGRSISYDFLVIAAGLELRYDLIEGLSQNKILTKPGICSIYSREGAEKTFEEFTKFTGGNAIFTFPNTPIKCAGAPQKICYLFEETVRMVKFCLPENYPPNIMELAGKRAKSDVIYCTSLGRIFGVPKYAEALMKVIEERGIQLNTRLNLKIVDTENKMAIFDVLNEDSQPTGDTKQFQYSLLHIGPPCSPIKALQDYAGSKNGLTDAKGWVSVDPETLRSIAYGNIFAIGDCANSPNAKTAAAISSQFKALDQNLRAAMENRELTGKYNGYASCPLVIDRKHVILAEFNSAGPLETTPLDQSKPSRIAYLATRYLMPFLYWQMLLKGYWKGPGTIRKILHFTVRKDKK